MSELKIEYGSEFDAGRVRHIPTRLDRYRQMNYAPTLSETLDLKPKNFLTNGNG